ncbi:a17f0dee-bb13-4f6c-977c-cf90d03748a3 [Sclerotinia trifoliorum]|uniref:A17f0dee-bb13-4f6c-977c-cf90d03748a3 n=1 Tax=Sclerotinia trifoliorum TaxID=28548 RepID=A0A8H2ZUN3_9HELO|nr:a17f0dee-bb13-4f6c-977c-cf90d03748a3 [Sclerotinia trifoliorum]
MRVRTAQQTCVPLVELLCVSKLALFGSCGITSSDGNFYLSTRRILLRILSGSFSLHLGTASYLDSSAKILPIPDVLAQFD